MRAQASNKKDTAPGSRLESSGPAKQLRSLKAPDSGIQFQVQQEAPAFSQTATTVQKKNKTGMPDNLKSGLENMSGMDLSDTKVHYNSSRPAQLNAHAFAQGNQIHLGPGQEKHLPHEGWHVVQQKQGRVKPTMQMAAAVPVNDDVSLEKEADVMGGKAIQNKAKKELPE